MKDRRTFLKEAGMVSLAGLLPTNTLLAGNFETKRFASEEVSPTSWADGSRLVVSVSMQFEAGGQPVNAESPFPQNMQKGFIDLPGESWYQYGYKEGIPRMLDNWDKLGIKVTSHMVGSAVLKNADLAREIVARGHEAAAHGMDWATQYSMPYETEKKFIRDGAEAIKKVTGFEPVGYNANWLRRGTNTLEILQELGFKYHIDDLSRDEPFLLKVKGNDFAVVPYTIRCNDIVLIEGKNFSADQFARQVILEFDQLYKESEKKRRQLSISFHDRIGGTPQMVAATTEIITYIQKHKGVSFKRKDEIARMAYEDKSTIRE
ncbi:polysaccharide deacetylase family protein [Flavobacterium sp. ENC]|uniref:polysaccharide deacetylase family protein n=1 Tax=Flavobacterium sp. ENC TaxID=2897330 RepID=UPI001E34B223|nr:polysaccharide deacetylase family protein [Flavobacterium sp. ENC]MCD0465990.1 polysaccharide deacetylase family protein [Flavobacterium sp. ENC]